MTKNGKDIERYLDSTIVRIYESLYDTIKESTDVDSTVEELNSKIDIILDALGLDKESVIVESNNDDDNNNKPKADDIEVSTDNNNDNNQLEIEDNDDDTLVIEEGLDTKGNYKLNFSERATDHFWYPGKSIYYFNTLDSLAKFMEDNEIPFTYNDADTLNNTGIVDNIYYSITKLQ